MNYKPNKCQHCGQTTTYLLSMDRGTVDILKAISTAVQRKGINEIHPRKEMEISGYDLDYRQMVEKGLLTSNHVGNLTRARAHGLIAKIRGKSGYYCITRKGAQFLNGKEIPRHAIMSKVDKRQIGYWTNTATTYPFCTIKDFAPEKGPEYWSGFPYEVVDERSLQKIYYNTLV